MSGGMLDPREPLVTTKDGRVTKDWYRFFASLSSGAGAGSGGEDVTPSTGVSPYSFFADQAGTLIISGGSIFLVEFTRDQINYYNVGTFRGMFPMLASDVMRVTYDPASPPTMTFFPG